MTSVGYQPLCALYLHSFIEMDVFLHGEPATPLPCRASAGVLSGPQMPELWNNVPLLDIGWFKHPKVIIVNDFLEFWSSSYSEGVTSTTWARVSQPLVSYEAFLPDTRLDMTCSVKKKTRFWGWFLRSTIAGGEITTTWVTPTQMALVTQKKRKRLFPWRWWS